MISISWISPSIRKPSIIRSGFLQIFLDLFPHFPYFYVEFAFCSGHRITGQDAADRLYFADDLLAEAGDTIRERMLVITPAINLVIRSVAHTNILGEKQDVYEVRGEIDEDDDLLTAMARELVTRQGVGERAAEVWRALTKIRPLVGTSVAQESTVSEEVEVSKLERSEPWLPPKGTAVQLSLF